MLFRSHQPLFLAAATLLIGMAWMAILPPFEGLDEIAHYSSIRQIADTGTIPLFGHSFIAQEVVVYKEQAPSPYALKPPYEDNGGLTYAPSFPSLSGWRITSPVTKKPAHALLSKPAIRPTGRRNIRRSTTC